MVATFTSLHELGMVPRSCATSHMSVVTTTSGGGWCLNDCIQVAAAPCMRHFQCRPGSVCMVTRWPPPSNASLTPLDHAACEPVWKGSKMQMSRGLFMDGIGCSRAGLSVEEGTIQAVPKGWVLSLIQSRACRRRSMQHATPLRFGGLQDKTWAKCGHGSNCPISEGRLLWGAIAWFVRGAENQTRGARKARSISLRLRVPPKQGHGFL